MLKKLTALLLAGVCMFTFAFAGCGTKPVQSDPAKDGAKKETAKPATLNFWTFQELHKGFWDDAVATWNKVHADQQITLKTDVYPYDELHNKLLIALQSGTGAPDISDIELGKFANFLKGTPALLPLNDIIEPVKDKLIMGRFDNYAKDGKYYGVDYHVGAEVMYYNKELLDKAGVKISDIKTWDDYLAAGKKVLAATGKPMATVETTEHWSYYPLINMQGSDIFSKDGKVILDNDVNIKTLNMLKQGMTDKIFVAAPGGFHHSEEYWAWMNKGNAASIWMPLWYMGRFTQYMPDLKGKMVVAAMPTFPGGKKSAGEGGTGTVITNQSKNQEIAKKLMSDTKLSKEGNLKLWSILGFDPIRSDVWSDPAMSAQNKYTDYFGKDVFSTLQSVVGDISGLNLNEKYPDAITLLQKNVMFKALKEQSQTPEQALKATAQELSKK